MSPAAAASLRFHAVPSSMEAIPLIDLRAQYEAIKPEIDAAIQQVLERGQFILGPDVDALERELAAFCGTAHAVAVASGTDALELALRACDIGPGDEVITTAFSFAATAEAILAVGARPVFVDIEPVTYTLDPDQIESAVTPKTKAILPVHLYGHPCQMDPIMRIAAQRRLDVIEDCAQALGATYRGARVGGCGRAGCLSFYPTKNLGAYGDAGMVVTNDPDVAERVRLLREHGSRRRYHHEILGTNSRLDELQAAILRVKLRSLDRWNEARRAHAQRYSSAIQRAGLPGIQLPREEPDCRHAYALYTIRLNGRDQVAERLAARGIATQVAYPSILPSQPALQPWVASAARFAQSCAAAAEVLSLPMYPELTDAAIARIAKALVEAARGAPTLPA